jgi:hypothetical protein
MYKEFPWDWFGISENPNITWNIIEKNKNKPWDWDCVSENPNITWDIVSDNIELFNPAIISRHPNITMDIINDYPKYNWNWNEILLNKNITLEFVHDNIIKFKKNNKATENPAITWDIYSYLNKFKKNSVNPSLIYSQANINWHLIKKNATDDDWYYVSLNPNITDKILKKHVDKHWNWSNLSKNLFMCHPYVIIEESE